MIRGKVSARAAYDAYRAVILTVAIGIAAWAMSGHLDYNGNGLPDGAPIQRGIVVQGQSPVDSFNEDVKIDTSQVSGR